MPVKKKTAAVESNKVVRVRKYIFVEEIHQNGKRCIRRTNDGFSIVELLGLLELTRSEIMETFKTGYPKPDEITRQFVKD
jgi:hypothetical protein